MFRNCLSGNCLTTCNEFTPHYFNPVDCFFVFLFVCLFVFNLNNNQEMSHPGIARLISAFRYRDGNYLVLEYASKGDLHSYVKK